MKKSEVENIQIEIHNLRKTGAYIRKEYVMMGDNNKIQWTVRHPCSKLNVKLQDDVLESYYDKFLATSFVPEMSFYDWLLYMIHKEYAK